MEGIEETRRCRTCGKSKSLDEFIPRRKGKNEYRQMCEECSRKASEYVKERYRDNADFREAVKGRSRKWATENAEVNRQRVREWERDNPTRARDGRRRYYYKHAETIAERRRIWYDQNPGLHADEHRQSKYGITAEQFADMIAKQNGRCAICTVPFVETPRVDHDHETGQIRDLLCDLCNRGLGYFLDSPKLLRAAADYIEQHRSKLQMVTWSDPGSNVRKLAE